MSLHLVQLRACLLRRQIFAITCVCVCARSANHLVLSTVNAWLVEYFEQLAGILLRSQAPDWADAYTRYCSGFGMAIESMFVAFEWRTNRRDTRAHKTPLFWRSTPWSHGMATAKKATLIICMYQFETGNKRQRKKWQKSVRVTENNNETWFEENFIYRAVITVISYYYRQCARAKERSVAVCETGGRWCGDVIVLRMQCKEEKDTRQQQQKNLHDDNIKHNVI